MPARQLQLAAFSILALFLSLFPFLWNRRFQRHMALCHPISWYPGFRSLYGSKDAFKRRISDTRVVVMGDIHGMNEPFKALLDKLSFDPASDVLLHVGDIIAKGPHEDSMSILAYMTTHNVTGVRGNHDQMVIEWRAWLEWIGQLDGGSHFLTQFHAKVDEADPDDPEAWAEKHIRKTKKQSKWWKRIPRGWKILSDHYRIARAMSDAEYQYLLSLPLVLHAPAVHAFIAHAGVLPSDPRYAPYHRRQPLARVPMLPGGDKRDRSNPEKTLPVLRRLQEAALLTEVPQNADPWVTLNMRGVLKDNSITRTKDGEPWADIWNRDMSSCAGFSQYMHLTKHDKMVLPCYPATAIYGHAASRGLDVKRWSVGLDTGCVYGRRLSALVLESTLLLDSSKSQSQSQSQTFGGKVDNEVDIEARKKKAIPFGDGEARIIDISCKLK
ncbi:Phosphoric monoester hydrolase [Mycena sanguinolenta]|uniref:Phosphoric monoester hydrolase n=1 Tax=Mycena sanguinolenta TaxID=230812 RepID=A0A8H7DKS0_9AGAR|nr:Phosphoric monoester hydrolase [Mycena sanguinolenta]